jgi:hypothetical protein
MLERQPAARPHLRLESRGQLHGETCRYSERNAGTKDRILHRAKVEPGVFRRPVSIRRQVRVGTKLSDLQLQPTMILSDFP